MSLVAATQQRKNSLQMDSLTTSSTTPWSQWPRRNANTSAPAGQAAMGHEIRQDEAFLLRGKGRLSTHKLQWLRKSSNSSAVSGEALQLQTHGKFAVESVRSLLPSHVLTTHATAAQLDSLLAGKWPTGRFAPEAAAVALATRAAHLNSQPYFLEPRACLQPDPGASLRLQAPPWRCHTLCRVCRSTTPFTGASLDRLPRAPGTAKMYPRRNREALSIHSPERPSKAARRSIHPRASATRWTQESLKPRAAILQRRHGRSVHGISRSKIAPVAVAHHDGDGAQIRAHLITRAIVSLLFCGASSALPELFGVCANISAELLTRRPLTRDHANGGWPTRVGARQGRRPELECCHVEGRRKERSGCLSCQCGRPRVANGCRRQRWR